MIRYLFCRGNPGANMYVTKFRLLGQSLTYKYVVKLLAVHIKNVTVSLRFGSSNHIVSVLKLGDFGENFQRFNKGEFVEVAGSNNACFRILCQNLRDEILGDYQHVCIRNVAVALTAVTLACNKRSSTPPLTGGRASP